MVSSESPELVVAELVRRTRGRCRKPNSDSLKRAYERVLRELDVADPGEAWRDGRDVIGEAYMRLLPAPDRRARGQIFTPLPAARLMADWALAELRSGTALDAGCGSGVLLIAAAEARKSSHVRLLGVDLDKTALLMTETNAALRGIPVETRKANFLLDDLGEHPQAIVCNPPYTRHHALTPAEKEAIADSLGDRLGLRLTRVASLHALFLARAVEVAAEGARLAFITPAHWLDTNYGHEVRGLLTGQAHLVAVLELSPEFFPNARTSAAITLIEKRASDAEPLRLALGEPLPDSEDLIAQLEALAGERIERRAGPPTRSRGHMVRLGELARVHRGVATGHNKFFVLNDCDRRRLRLARSYLHPCIASPRLVAGTTLTTEVLEQMPDSAPRWLLAARVHRKRGPLADYLAHGEALEIAKRYLCRQRRPWFAIRWRGSFPILFSYLNKENPRFVRNYSGAIPLNTWLVIDPRPGIDADALFRALSDPDVMEQAAAASRHYGDGLWKLEPSEVEQLLVADVRPQSEGGDKPSSRRHAPVSGLRTP